MVANQQQWGTCKCSSVGKMDKGQRSTQRVGKKAQAHMSSQSRQEKMALVAVGMQALISRAAMYGKCQHGIWG